MKKTILYSLILAGILAFPLHSVLAVTIPNPLSVGSFEELLDAVVNFVFWIGITLAPVMLIIAGFIFVTSAGSPERVNTAKKWALYTIIGLAIVLLAKGLVAVLQSIIGVPEEEAFLGLSFFGIAEYFSNKKCKKVEAIFKINSQK